jgi:hypothetical protein
MHMKSFFFLKLNKEKQKKTSNIKFRVYLPASQFAMDGWSWLQGLLFSHGLGEDTAWGSSLCPHCPHVWRLPPLVRSGGPGILIMHCFHFGDVCVDEQEGRREYILITSAALKEFPQTIFSTSAESSPHCTPPPIPVWNGSWPAVRVGLHSVFIV